MSKFPSSNIRQMAKKLESSQATAKHMRQVTKDPQATQVNLLRHQRTELSPSKFQRKQNKKYRSRQPSNKQYQKINTKKECLRQMEDSTRIKKNIQVQKTGAVNVVIHTLEGYRCPASRYQCKHCHKFGHFIK